MKKEWVYLKKQKTKQCSVLNCEIFMTTCTANKSCTLSVTNSNKCQKQCSRQTLTVSELNCFFMTPQRTVEK